MNYMLLKMNKTFINYVNDLKNEKTDDILYNIDDHLIACIIKNEKVFDRKQLLYYIDDILCMTDDELGTMMSLGVVRFVCKLLETGIIPKRFMKYYIEKYELSEYAINKYITKGGE